MELNRKRKITEKNEELKIMKIEEFNLLKFKDIVEIIFLFLSIIDLLDLNLVCRDWNIFLSSEKFWEKKIIEELSALSVIRGKAQFSWKKWIHRKINVTWKKGKNIINVNFLEFYIMRSYFRSTDEIKSEIFRLIDDFQNKYEKSKNLNSMKIVNSEYSFHCKFIADGSIVTKLPDSKLNLSGELMLLSLDGKELCFKFFYECDGNSIEINQPIIFYLEFIDKNNQYIKNEKKPFTRKLDILMNLLKFTHTCPDDIALQIFMICTPDKYFMSKFYFQNLTEFEL